MFRSREQEHFNALIARHIAVRDAPLLLEGGTGLGKTRAFLAALADCDARAAIVLPTHQLIDQLLESADLEAARLAAAPFRPAGMCESRAEYRAQRADAMESRVMLCTAASVMIDQRLKGGYNGAARRDYLLFDEADQLPQAAALQRDLTISAQELEDAGVPLSGVAETVAALLAKPDLDPELRARAMMLEEAIDEPAWFRPVGKDGEGGLALWHRLPGRLLKRVANRGGAAFVSATLTVSGSFDDFRRSMGIGETSRFSGVVEPKEHGRITVRTPTDRDPAEVAAEAERPCLVVTPGHDDADELAARIPGAVRREPAADGETRETASAAAARVGEDGVLVAAYAWAGLDTPVRWRAIVVPRIPFGKPVELDGKIESGYVDSRNVAARRMRQVVGRGLRAPDAECAIYICDERYRKLGEFLPERFRDSWEEGGRADIALSSIERHPLIRYAALKHYGCKCHVCGFVPPRDATRAVEIHHLHPLAEGKRETKIEDVIPLCATCHRIAHSRTPPIPIPELVKKRAPSAGDPS